MWARARRIRRHLAANRGWYLGALVGGCAAYVIASQLVLVTWLVSNSMTPTLTARSSALSSDWVLVERGTLRMRSPRRNDLVFFRAEDGVQVIKRVVGLPGEVVELRRGALLVDGRPASDIPRAIQERYVNGGAFGPGRRFLILPNQYLVLGDNSEDSHDSRFYGCLDRSRFLGVARAIVWPPRRMTTL